MLGCKVVLEFIGPEVLGLRLTCVCVLEAGQDNIVAVPVPVVVTSPEEKGVNSLT